METLKFKSERIVGRQKETRELQDVLEELKTGRGKTIFVSGEAGIGKTRLMDETIKYMSSKGIRTIKVYCLPHESTDSYLPFTEILAQIAPGQPLIPPYEEKHVSLDEVFLVYKNGVLIAHTSKKERGLDSDVVAGMFTAVQNFVKDTFGKSEALESELRRMEYGEKNILIEHGRNIYIAAVLAGPTGTKSVYRDLRNTVALIEKDYPVLERWDGDLDKTKGTETVVKMLTGKDYPIEETIDKSRLETERLRVFEHVLNIITTEAKKQHLLIFLDDLHWADRSSLHLLHYLSRNTRDYPVILCGAYRPEDITSTPKGEPHPLKEILGFMRKEELITEIPLDRLKHDDTAEIVKSIFAHSFSTQFTKRLHKETEGNPFFTEELLKALVLDGIIYRHNAVWKAKDISKVVIPGSVKDTVMRLVSALDKDCQEVLKYASVIGQTFQFQTLARTTGKDKEKLAELLEKIEKKGIIYSEEDILRFNHAKLQEAIYSDIPKYRRSILHEKTAQALEELNKENLNIISVELAHHYQQAGISEKTAEYALLAAENAEKKYSPDEASKNYTIALWALEKLKQTPENKEKMMRVADKIAYMYYISGDWDACMDYIWVVQKLAIETKDNMQLAECYCNMGMIQIPQGEYDTALRNLETALEVSQKIIDIKGMGEAYYWMGRADWLTGKLDDAMNVLNKALVEAKKINDKKLTARAMTELGKVFLLKGDYNKSMQLNKESLCIAESIDDKYTMTRAINDIGDTYRVMGDWNNAIKWFEKSMKICEEICFLPRLSYGLLNIAEWYIEKGNCNRAVEYMGKGIKIADKLGERRLISRVYNLYGIIYKGKKDWKKSEEYFEKAVRIAKELMDIEVLCDLYVDFGKMYKAKGEQDKARIQFQQAIELYEKLGNKQKIKEVKKEMEKL